MATGGRRQTARRGPSGPKVGGRAALVVSLAVGRQPPPGQHERMRYESTESVLEVPGGRLRSFVRGSGPALVLIAGGHGDASRTEALARHLAYQYTVLTYDRRGLSGSTTSAPATT